MIFTRFHRWYDHLGEPQRTLGFFAVIITCLALPLLVSLVLDLSQVAYQVAQLLSWLLIMLLGLDRAAYLNRPK
jgi:hypothetical protein